MERPVKEILKDVKKLALEYYKGTGKPLGVTGEIGEFEAAEKMGLKLAEARQEGYNAISTTDGNKRIQITTRRILLGKRERVSKINTEKEFDSVMLVLLREDFEVLEIWEAGRKDVIYKLDAPGSNARNKRRQMSINQFKSIAKKNWPQ